ncbi:MAG: cell division protein SepF [Carnobacterium sp.]|uniref:Cell division protein SepF n=1 Tax=Carnobacterium antarcticum TaxID=2126436 RepID=A0ABW4NNA0_9LACT|nr:MULTISPECIES: cell division protein SepF [unclassified Carnobacterium]ALV20794.1 FtsZ-interacting protein [Carnobacterium sp. CP1]QQP70955.1 cell division protein SepF [Carnobacterium sp. CS13]
MGMMNNFNRFFGLDEEDETNYDEMESTKEVDTPIASKLNKQRQTETSATPIINTRREQAKSNKVVSISQQPTPQQAKITIFEPRVYSEVQEIADVLLNNQSVVLNFVRMDENQAKRIVDFLTGTVYALDGDIQRIGDEIFLCTPHNVAIDGALTDIMRDKDLY